MAVNRTVAGMMALVVLACLMWLVSQSSDDRRPEYPTRTFYVVPAPPAREPPCYVYASDTKPLTRAWNVMRHVLGTAHMGAAYCHSGGLDHTFGVTRVENCRLCRQESWWSTLQRHKDLDELLRKRFEALHERNATLNVSLVWFEGRVSAEDVDRAAGHWKPVGVAPAFVDEVAVKGDADEIYFRCFDATGVLFRADDENGYLCASLTRGARFAVGPHGRLPAMRHADHFHGTK